MGLMTSLVQQVLDKETGQDKQKSDDLYFANDGRKSET
jgi:hypothetical protein